MIGGNIKAELQKKTVSKNPIGEQIESWETVTVLTGFLDLISGSSSYETYNAKMKEASHVFICDYVPVDPDVNQRMMINGQKYDVTYIDNPMNLNRQLEIYLK